MSGRSSSRQASSNRRITDSHTSHAVPPKFDSRIIDRFRTGEGEGDPVRATAFSCGTVAELSIFRHTSETLSKPRRSATVPQPGAAARERAEYRSEGTDL